MNIKYNSKVWNNLYVEIYFFFYFKKYFIFFIEGKDQKNENFLFLYKLFKI